MTYGSFLRGNAPFLAAGALLTFCSSFGQTFLISVFAGEIRAAFGLTHGQWGGIYTLGTFASAATMLWAGVLADRYRARTLGIVVVSLLAAACLLMASVPGAWLLPVAVYALRLFGQGMASHIAVVAMARWFARARGRALSVAGIGYAFGEAFLPVAIVAALGAAPWRVLWVVFAVFLLAALPLLSRLLRMERTPQSLADETSATGMLDRCWTRGEALRHWLFWFVAPSILAPSAFTTAFFFQQVHLAETKGWTHAGLAATFPLFTFAGILTAIGSGFAIDRFGSARLMPVFQLPMALGFVVAGAADSLAVAGLGVMLMGLGQGANSTLPNAFWAEFYGTRHLGAIKSLATAVMVLGSALGPGITGRLIDSGVAFEDQMAWIASYFVLASALVAVGVGCARRMLPSSA